MLRLKKNKIKLHYAGVILVSAILLAGFLYAVNFSRAAQGGTSEIKELNDEIKVKQDEIEDLRDKIAAYETSLTAERSKAGSLKNQISILEAQIGKKETEIRLNKEQVEKTNLEIEKTKQEIGDTEDKILDKQDKLANLLREIYRSDLKSDLEIMIMYDSISDFFNQLRVAEKIQNEVNNTLVDFKNLKVVLKGKEDELETEKVDLENFQVKLVSAQENLLDQQNNKEYILVKTRSSEVRYQSLVAELKLEQERINAEIVALERAIRAKLEGNKSKLNELGEATFIWPVPSRYITTYFHDPDYPFRYVFEHPALDIRAKQGTPVRAAAAGYVAKVRDGGKYGYSYIMLIHSNGFSTVYGHLSAMYVQADQFVTQGEVIGASGGMPGTPGAGPLTTGPHLHFEVRKDGIPVNPADYLP